MIEISRKDIFWNYTATFLKIASFIILLPFILRMMPSDTVGIWSVFITITSFSVLIDFGFNSSFARNVTYVFSGIRSLKVNGFESIQEENFSVDFGLLKGLIKSMRWLYLRLSILLLILLATVGTYYIYILLKSYQRNHLEVYIAWGILCIVNIYSLFTLYYDALLQGKGLIKKAKQIFVIGQIVYLTIAIILLLIGQGLIAIISAQAAAVILVRWLSYHAFFTKEIRKQLKTAPEYSAKEIMKAVYPNAVKIGLTGIGGFTVQKSAIIIGSLYLALDDIASFSITIQLIGVLSNFGLIYTTTYIPKIGQLRVQQKIREIKELYLKGIVVIMLTFLLGGTMFLLFGQKAFTIIGSQTQLLPKVFIFAALVIALLESNHAHAGTILLTGNEVPFFKASLTAGAISLILLFIFFEFSDIRIWAMVLSPGIAHLYNNFKWPYVVFMQLNITLADVRNAFKYFNPVNLFLLR